MWKVAVWCGVIFLRSDGESFVYQPGCDVMFLLFRSRCIWRDDSIGVNSPHNVLTFYLRALLLRFFEKHTIESFNKDGVILTSDRTCWFTRVDRIGWRAEGWERRDTGENNSLVSILSRRWPCARLITRFLFLLLHLRATSAPRSCSYGLCWDLP